MESEGDQMTHDPLCSLSSHGSTCIGCVLVVLRSDASYADDPAVRRIARYRLLEIADCALDHLRDALAWEGEATTT
jgi:hypothetical protein